jgi:hypothetical protein
MSSGNAEITLRELHAVVDVYGHTARIDAPHRECDPNDDFRVMLDLGRVLTFTPIDATYDSVDDPDGDRIRIRLEPDHGSD